MVAYAGLKFSENEGRLLVSIEPVAGCPQLDVETLRGLLEQAGAVGWFFLNEALVTAVARYNASVEVLELPVAERRDAGFSLEISADSMIASVNFVPAYGGEAATPEQIFAALADAGVTYGINQAAVISLCSKALPERVAVAMGVAVENGRDTRFELLAADTRDRVPQVDEHGLIDFRDLGAIPLVVAEQALMRRIQPTDGVDGLNVRGEILEALPGRSEGFAENLIGAYVANDDANLLRAVFNGQPVRCGNGVTVEQVLTVRNVNVATGNITFDGTVHVDGEVLPGMKVHATGDIIVTGVIDGAELEAGGDIRVGGGIIAQSRVRAGGLGGGALCRECARLCRNGDCHRRCRPAE